MGILNKVLTNKVKWWREENKTKQSFRRKEFYNVKGPIRPYRYSANHRDIPFFFKMSSNQIFGSQAVLEFAQLAAAHCSSVELPSYS